MAVNRFKVLVIGAGGQIGMELTSALRKKYQAENVIASDIRDIPHLSAKGPFELLDVMDKQALYDLIEKHEIKQVYNLAALLSATGEKNPEFAWKLNMEGLLNSLDAAKDLKLDRLFWPSSIAVFGPGTPSHDTPQNTIMDPNTVYGISKLAGERWCEYYHSRYGVDVRSVRYPGLIGYKSQPGGGTTDYAVDIFYKALETASFECFLEANTALPMMFMEDAIQATMDLMEAPADSVKVRSSYNLAGVSFDPATLAKEIEKHIPSFTISYNPDERQDIASSWPSSIDEFAAQSDWGWKQKYDLEKMVSEMLTQIKAKLTPHS